MLTFLLSLMKNTYKFIFRRLLKQPAFLLRKSIVSWTSYVGSRTILVESTVGKYSYLAAGVYLNKTKIGNYCSIAADAKIGGMEHSWWWGSTSLRISDKYVHDKETLIEDDVWIASNVVVKQGVHIGRGAVVGANAVVLKNVPPYTIVAGVPAKEIKKRFSENIIREIETTRFWEYPPNKAREILNKINFTNK